MDRDSFLEDPLRTAKCGAAALLFAFSCLASFGAGHRFTVTLKCSGTIAADVPLAVRVSPGLVRGFDYSAAGDGRHFEITDENGLLLPYEIDTWNPDGESLLWVKVPVFAEGKRLTVVYGRTDEDMTARAAEVWSNYIGVWHMNGVDASGKYPNSAGDARFAGVVSSFSRTGMPGVFGQSVQVFTNNVHSPKGTPGANEKGGVFIPDGGDLLLESGFALSGWFNHETVENPVANGKDTSYAFRWDNIFCKRRHPESNNALNNGSTAGFSLRVGENSNVGSRLEVDTLADRNTALLSSELKNGFWRHLAVSFDADGMGWMRVDGASITNYIASVTDNDEPLVIGNTAVAYPDNEGDRAWGGYVDEVRLSRGAPSDAYLSAEYVAMTVAQEYSSATCLLRVERNEFFDDSVTITSDIPPTAGGEYYPGTTITLTAVPGATGTFRKWYGDVKKADREKATISFVIEGDAWIYARFVHPWALSSDKTTMTDGNFTVYVSPVSQTGHTLIVGRPEEAGLSPTNDTGVGTVDLGGPIRLAGDDTPWTIARFAAHKGSQSIPICREGNFRYLSPGTVSVAQNTQLFHRGDDDNGKQLTGAPYEMIVLDESMEGKFVNEYYLSNQTQLETLIIEAPNLAELGGTRVPYKMPLSNTKFDWWDLSSVTWIRNGFFANEWGSYISLQPRVRIKGSLTLPSMRGVDWVLPPESDEGTQLFMMRNVEEISLGGKDEETTVTNLCTYAFAGNSALRKLTLHAAPDMQVGRRIFASHTYNTENGVETVDGIEYHLGTRTSPGRVPDEIRFTGKAISAEAIENLLGDCPSVDSAAKPVAIYASQYQEGWSGPGKAGWISSPTGAERAAYPGKKLLGVYRAGGQAPSGKAVIIHCVNSWDKVVVSGFPVRLR